jgi:type IV pilus assembly protein PilW
MNIFQAVNKKTVASGAAGRNSKGVTLIELLVGLAIGLIIALAAASAYLGSRGSAVATENASRTNETGKLALDYIGREIQLAGFYPAQSPANTTATNFIGAFTNTKNTATVAYNQGIFGCDGAKFNVTGGVDTCPAAVANAPDSIVLNYFTSDTFGTGTVAITGLMRDCNGSLVTSDAANNARNATVPPLPLYISNRIGLDATTYAGVNGAISTFSLACSGNGGAGYQPIFEGIEDLVFRYGVHTGIDSQTPERFYTAAEVSALPDNGWQRVTAVQVCIVVRSLENSRLGAKGATTLTYENCRGGSTTYPTTNKLSYKRFMRIFAARNNLNGTS